MKSIRLIALFFLSLTLTACAAFLNTQWVHPEKKTQADFNSDSMDCLYQWTLLTPDSDTPYLIPEEHDGPLGIFMINADIDPDFEAECLEEKGWVRVEKTKD